MKIYSKINSSVIIHYPKDSKYCNGGNNLLLRKNDKAGGVPRKGFLDLKSKMCTSITEDNCQPKNAKDINKNVTGAKLKHEDYKNFLFNRS